ncbi:O-antigen ligase family protein [Desulfobacterota bacterium M19]
MKQLYAIQISAIISTIREEGWAFKFICLYLFFEYVRPQSIYPVIDIIPWSFIILALTAVVLLLSGDLQAQPNILNKLIVCYGLIVVFSITVTSLYPAVSLLKWRIFFNWFFIYFLIVLIVNNEKRFFIFFLSFLLYSFKMSQHGFLSWLQRGFAFAGWGVTGAPGWFNNSGEVGIQMCIYVPLAIAFIMATYKLLSKPKLIFFLLMPFTGIATAIASSSRGALVGLAVAGIRPLLIRPKIFFVSSIILSMVAVLTIVSIPTKSMQRFQKMGKDKTSEQRLERWHDGLETINKYPVFGVGFDAWAEYFPQHYQIEFKGTKLIHNIFLQCGTELGFAGLSVFILMIIACFVNTRMVRKLSKGRDDQFLAIMSYGFDAALLGYLGSGFFVTVMYYPYFWIHCAMTTCLHTAAQKKFTS